MIHNGKKHTKKPGGYLTAEYSFMKLLMKVINYILKKKKTLILFQVILCFYLDTSDKFIKTINYIIFSTNNN